MVSALLGFLEFSGLVLALLDFTGWAKLVQATIDEKRYKLFSWLHGKGNERLVEKLLWFIGVPAWLLFGWGFYALITDLELALPIFAGFVIVSLGPLVLLFLLLPLFYNLLLTMNRPPSGTLGTIGLTVAFVSFVLQRTDTITTFTCRVLEPLCK